MALVSVLDTEKLKDKRHQETDVAKFFYGSEKAVPLVMTKSPEIMHIPEKQQEGSIRINKHKTIPLNPDNTFYYGAWPQESVSPDIFKKLKQEAGQTICYYKIKGNTYYEYELNNQRYIFAPGHEKWFKVQFIKWIYDPKTQKAYTEKALWNSDEADDKSLRYFWLQAFQATKKMQKSIQQDTSNLKKRLKTGIGNLIKSTLNTIRTK